MELTEPSRVRNLFKEFDLWTKIHYYAFVNRSKYPNMFFFHFSSSGILVEGLNKSERNIILTSIAKFKNHMNGMWGYLSLLLENKNGFEIYKFVSRSEFFEHSIAFPCFQDASPDFDFDIQSKCRELLSQNEPRYVEVQKEFEGYISINPEKKQEFESFLYFYEDKIIWAASKQSLVGLINKNAGDCKNDLELSLTYLRKNAQKENQVINEIPQTKKRKIISDNENEDTQPNQNQNINNNLQESSFWDSSSSSNERSQSFHDTGYSSPNKNYIKKIYESSYIQRTQQVNGYTSDNPKHMFRSDKKVFMSDDENGNYFPSSEKKAIDSNRKVWVLKTGKKSTFKAYNANEFNINRLKRQLLLRKKTKRNKKLGKKANDSAKKKSYTNTNQSVCGSITSGANISSKKQKTKCRIINQNRQNVCVPEKKVITTLFKSTKNYSKDETKSVVSAFSILSSSSNYSTRTKRNMHKQNSEAVKNFFMKGAKICTVLSAVKKETRKANHNADQLNKSIQTFFPTLSNVSSTKESETIKYLGRLINNTKYKELLSILEKDKPNYEKINLAINALTSKLINDSNEIKSLTIDSITVGFNVFHIDDTNFNFVSEPNESIKKLFQFYKKNIIALLSQINPDESNVQALDCEALNTIVENIHGSETLIKHLIKNYESLVVNNQIEIERLILSDVRELFILFLSKFLNENNNDKNNETNIVTVGHLLITFLVIIKVILCNAKRFARENQSLALKEGVVKFIKLLAFLSLIKMYHLEERSLKLLDDDNLICISVMKIISEIFVEISYHKPVSVYECPYLLLKEIFNEFLYPGGVGNLENQFAFTSLKTCFTELTTNYLTGNFFDFSIFEKNLKSTLFTIFILSTNNLSNLNELSIDLKKVLQHSCLLHLYHRYYLLFLLLFSESSNGSLIYPNYMDELHVKCVTSKENSTYYDVEILVKLIDNIRFRQNKICDTNLLQKYLISDSKTLLMLDKNWKVDSRVTMKYMFQLFEIIGLNSLRKSITVDSNIIKEEIFKLLPLVFENERDADEVELNPLVDFIFDMCKIIQNILKVEIDDKSRKKTLSKFITMINPKLIENVNENDSVKLGHIPIIAIVLSLIVFTNIFENSEQIEFCVKKICEIMDFNKASSLLKSFNLAILLKIIGKFSKKKMSVVKYIELLNKNIKTVIKSISDLEQVLPNLHNNSQMLKEYSQALHYYLKNIVMLSKTDPVLFVNNSQILDEMKEILLVQNGIPNNYKKLVVTAIDSLIEQFENVVEQSNIDMIAATSKNTIMLEEGFEIEIPNDLLEMNVDTENTMPVAYKRDILNNIHLEFLNKLKNVYLTLLNLITHQNYFSNSAQNATMKNKISFDLLQLSCDVQAKLYAILEKYDIFKAINFFSKFSVDSIFFSASVAKFHSSNLENITQIPYKAFNEFLLRHSKYFQDLLIKRDYVNFKHFLSLFFISLFINFPRCGNIGLMNMNIQELSASDAFSNLFLENLLNVKDIISDNLKSLKSELSNNTKNAFTTDRIREESSYYNLLLLLINQNPHLGFSGVYQFIDCLLNEISLSKNVNKIESRFFFELFNYKVIDEVMSRCSMKLDIPTREYYLSTILRTFLKILNAFESEYINGTIEIKALTFLDCFINKISSESTSDELFTVTMNNDHLTQFMITLMSHKRPHPKFSPLISKFNSTFMKKIESLLIGILSNPDDDYNFPHTSEMFLTTQLDRNTIIEFLFGIIDHMTLQKVTIAPEVCYFLTKVILNEIFNLDEYNRSEEYIERLLALMERNQIRNIPSYYLFTLIMKNVLSIVIHSNELLSNTKDKLQFLLEMNIVYLSNIIHTLNAKQKGKMNNENLIYRHLSHFVSFNNIVVESPELNVAFISWFYSNIDTVLNDILNHNAIYCNILMTEFFIHANPSQYEKIKVLGYINKSFSDASAKRLNQQNNIHHENRKGRLASNLIF